MPARHDQREGVEGIVRRVVGALELLAAHREQGRRGQHARGRRRRRDEAVQGAPGHLARGQKDGGQHAAVEGEVVVRQRHREQDSRRGQPATPVRVVFEAQPEQRVERQQLGGDQVQVADRVGPVEAREGEGVAREECGCLAPVPGDAARQPVAGGARQREAEHDQQVLGDDQVQRQQGAEPALQRHVGVQQQRGALGMEEQVRVRDVQGLLAGEPEVPGHHQPVAVVEPGVRAQAQDLGPGLDGPARRVEDGEQERAGQRAPPGAGCERGSHLKRTTFPVVIASPTWSRKK